MTYRPYPNADRALSQVDRGRLRARPAPSASLADVFAYLESDDHRARMRAIGVAVGDALNLAFRRPAVVTHPR